MPNLVATHAQIDHTAISEFVQQRLVKEFFGNPVHVDDVQFRLVLNQSVFLVNATDEGGIVESFTQNLIAIGLNLIPQMSEARQVEMSTFSRVA